VFVAARGERGEQVIRVSLAGEDAARARS